MRIVARGFPGFAAGNQGVSSGRAAPAPGQDLRVELDWLETFLAVADRGGFTAASATVHRSQSRVSAHIAALERDLGVRLVDRTHRPARLTAAGEVFARHAREVVAGVGAARSAVGALRGMDAEPITVLTTPCIGAAFFPSVLAEVAKTHPGMRVSARRARRVRPRAAAARQRSDARRPPAQPGAAAAGSARARAVARAAAGRGARRRRAGPRRRSRVARRARGPTVDRRRRGRRDVLERLPAGGAGSAHGPRTGRSAARRRRHTPDDDRPGAGGRRRRRRQRGRARPPRPLRPRRPRHRRTHGAPGRRRVLVRRARAAAASAWSCSAPSSTLRCRPARHPPEE